MNYVSTNYESTAHQIHNTHTRSNKEIGLTMSTGHY